MEVPDHWHTNLFASWYWTIKLVHNGANDIRLKPLKNTLATRHNNKSVHLQLQSTTGAFSIW